MVAKGGLLVTALALSSGCSEERPPSPAPPAPSVTIEVDASAPGAPLEPVWAYFGYDEPSSTTAPEGKELLRTLAASQAEAAPPYVRTHFLFNTGDGAPALKWGSTNVYTETATGEPVFDYRLLDGIMDATVESGARPLFELGFMPQALSTNPEPYRNSSTYTLDGGCFFPPRDYDRWAQLITAWATHAKERYPGAATQWQWELWNEPDLPYWQGTQEDYFRLYDYTERALHAVMPEAPLGGPAVAGAGSLFLRQFLRHCATGTNAVTGEVGTRLDLVTFHAKGGVSLKDGEVRMSLGGQLDKHDVGFAQVAAVPQLARTPIVISEADPEACAACAGSESPIYAYRTSPAYGAYVVAMMKRSLELAARRGVNLKGVLTWAFTFPGAPYFTGYRELSTNGVHLPVLNAFKLLGRLRGAELPVTSSGARPLSELLETSVVDQPDVDALATKDGERLHVLVWNYHDDLVSAPPVTVAVRLRLPPSFSVGARLTHVRVDEAHGNAFAVWTAQGKPPTPSPQQLTELRAAMEPAELESRQLSVNEGSATVSLSLPRFGLSLLELEPAAAP